MWPRLDLRMKYMTIFFFNLPCNKFPPPAGGGNESYPIIKFGTCPE